MTKAPSAPVPTDLSPKIQAPQPTETPLKRQKSKFLQLLDQQPEQTSEGAARTYVRQLSQSALKMKRSLRKEFADTVEKINLNTDQIAFMK